jgi:hypothetical protein
VWQIIQIALLKKRQVKNTFVSIKSLFNSFLNNIMTEDKRKLLITYLDSFLSRNASYHDHKETMVNVALLLQLALFGAVIAKEWSSIKISNWQVGIIYFFFWSLVHVYMKWQLSNKVRSSIYHNGFDKSLRQLIANTEIDEVNKNEILPVRTFIKSKFSFYFQLVIKNSPVINYDYSIEELPTFIERNIHEAIQNGSHGSFHERLMNRASFIILAISLVRIFWF